MNNKIKKIVLLTSLVLLAVGIVGTTVAYLFTNAGPVVNTFTPTEVPIEVEENFDGKTKSGVQITNEGDIPAYIRARVIINWVEKEEPYSVLYLDTPPLPTIEEVTKGKNEAWIQIGEYFYYKDKVDSKEKTESLISSYTPDIPANADYTLSIDIIAQSIQADGVSSDRKTPAEIAWGVKFEDNTVIAVPTITP